ncbi:MAG TPA: cation-translocating P-type ATPase [Bryobacteraceae bacterium]|nr:cation-translocating P-type ATPase [Bryobacteraceae bacterium]
MSESHNHVQEDDCRGEHVEWLELGRIALVGLAIAFTWFRLWRPLPHFDVVGFAAVLIGGYPIFREAFTDLLSRRMTMELSMTIALLAALLIREVFTALLIVFFVLIAEVLEELTVGRGRRAIQDLLDLLPQQVELRRADGIRPASLGELSSGDVVLVRPGGRVPVDGIVVGGHSFIDQATITGESMPVEKVSGAHVYAGTVNQSGILEIQTKSVGRDTAFGRIIQAVEQAERSRAPVQRTADRLAGYLVYFALACALFTFILTHNARSTISVIIVAGACGIAAGTPLAILGAIGRAARHGAIVKGGLYMETLSKVDTVVLDKTGTLTLGNPEVLAIDPAPGIERERLLRVAASAERYSEHPLARAILKTANAAALGLVDPDGFTYTPGKGISCRVDGEETVVGNRAFLLEHDVKVFTPSIDHDSATEISVAQGHVHLGSLRIADVLRPEAVEAVRALKEMSVRTVLLTGDTAAIGRAVGQQLQVDDVEAELLPQQKLDRVRALRSAGRTVAMVGDGINDAPALMEANVGIAMGSGTEVARESANVLLLGNDLLKVVEVIKIARRCNRIIMFNFAGTLGVDGVGVGLAAFGFLNPVLAVLIHVTSELIFILNSARLLSRSSKASPVATARETEAIPAARQAASGIAH